MAVQMMASSSQDLLGAAAPIESAQLKSAPQDAAKFEDELVSVSKDSATEKPRQEAVAQKPSRPTKHVAKAGDKIDTSDADIADDAPLVADIRPEDESAPLTAADFKTIVALMTGDLEEVDIEAMIAQAAAETSKPRFDPDAILSGLATAPAVKGEDAPVGEQDEKTGAEELAVPVPELMSAALFAEADSEIPDADPEIGIELMGALNGDLVVGEDEDGEIAVKVSDADKAELPDAATIQLTSEQVPADTKRSAKIDRAPVESDREGEVEALDTDHAPLTGKIELPKSSEPDGDDHAMLDAKIAEMLEKYRGAKRGDRADGDKGITVRDASDRTAESARRVAQSTQSRRAVESAKVQPRDIRTETSATREVPFGDTLASKLREAAELEFVPGANEAPRPGAVYQLDRANAFGDGLGAVLEFMRTGETHEARIVVEPPALGHIDVSLRAGESGLQATFKVDNDHLKMMVQQQIDILKSSLETQGIHVSNIAVDLRSKDDQSGQGAAGAKQGKKGRGVSGTDGDDEAETEGVTLARLDLERGHLHWVG